MRRFLLLSVFLLALMLAGYAVADEAPEITDRCSFTLSGKSIKNVANMLDRDYGTYVTVYSGKYLEAESEGDTIGGVFIQFHDRGVSSTLEAKVEGVWKKVADCGQYLTEWFSVPNGTTSVRLNNTARSRMFINEFYVYGYGIQPGYAAKWHTGEQCDLMLVSCHPDDEVLWFGGLLPTYARERGYEVQVVVVVPATPERRLELLDSLWHCGVTRYPHFLGIGDSHHSSLQDQYKVWSKDSVCFSIVKAIRTYRPAVIVSHDLYGEYGHGAHMATADCTRLAFDFAASPKKYPRTAKEYGTWQAQKLYLHLYHEGQIEMDWHQPLESFGGKTGYTVAEEAFQYHKSQLHAWTIEDGGKLSNAKFGLVYSMVGEDIDKNDFMENTGIVGHPENRFQPEKPVGYVEKEEPDDDVFHIDLNPGGDF
ncbi:MAG: PIG-L family deacetylase [Clostridiales bacterium]|nr:PIG-L family deacetylase [Clostridia bacterium]MCR4882594.1 PIG-L family deacetylase [Clostridiales bacterium]